MHGQQNIKIVKVFIYEFPRVPPVSYSARQLRKFEPPTSAL